MTPLIFVAVVHAIAIAIVVTVRRGIMTAVDRTDIRLHNITLLVGLFVAGVCAGVLLRSNPLYYLGTVVATVLLLYPLVTIFEKFF